MNMIKSWLDRILSIINVSLMAILVITVVYQVFARYLFNAPNSPLEEFSRISFMWLILLGGVYVAGLNKHLSIDMLKRKLSPSGQLILELFINVLILIFALLILVYGGCSQVQEASAMGQISPSLQWSMAKLYLVLPISGLMLCFYIIYDIFGIVKKHSTIAMKAIVLFVILAVAIELSYLIYQWGLHSSGWFTADGIDTFISDYQPIIILFGCFFLMLFLSVPITFAIALASFACIVSMTDSSTGTSISSAVSTITQKFAMGFDSSTLFAIPFFVLAGNIMNSGGIALRLVNLAKKLVGFLPGALVHCNILANAMFGAISGSAVAAAAAVGGIMSPMQEKEGYDPSFCAAVNIASAPTGLLIPPSNVLIMYSLASGGTSVAALFLAGYIPGLLMALALMIVSGFIVMRKTMSYFDILKAFIFTLPLIAIIAAVSAIIVWAFILSNTWGLTYHFSLFGNLHSLMMPIINHPINFPHWVITINFLGCLAIIATLWGVRFIAHKRNYDCKSLFDVFVDAIPSLLLIIIVIGGIVAGIFTSTEGSAIAVVYTLFLSMCIYKEIKIMDLPTILLDAVVTSTMVLLLVCSSMGMSWAMTNADVPQLIADTLSAFSNNPFLILLIMNIILLIVGTFMDITPAILIFTPIFLPLAKQMGIDQIQFGIMIVMNLSIGLCTPPVGSILFVGCGVAKVNIEQVIKPLIPMFLALFFVLFLITHYASLSLYLPRAAGLM